jgi:hypothetical protein
MLQSYPVQVPRTNKDQPISQNRGASKIERANDKVEMDKFAKDEDAVANLNAQ